MLILIIVLILLFGGGGGYYGHTRWGPGGGAGIGLGTILLFSSSSGCLAASAEWLPAFRTSERSDNFVIVYFTQGL